MYDKIETSPSEFELTEGEKDLLELFRLIPEEQQLVGLAMMRATLGRKRGGYVMPKYRLSAFENECALLREFIKEQERELTTLEVCKDMYEPDIFNSLKETRLSLIESYREKLIPLENKLNEFRAAYTPYDKHFDDAPLEYLYQAFLNKNLTAILRKVEIVYDNTVNEILNSSEFITRRKAKQIASHLMRSTILGYTIQKYVTDLHLEELESLPCYIQGASYAINEKYKYFADRIQCCLEIGNKLIELERY